MAIKARKPTPQMSANERAFVKKQALGQFTTGKPSGRGRKPPSATPTLTSALMKSNGVQSGKRVG